MSRVKRQKSNGGRAVKNNAIRFAMQGIPNAGYYTCASCGQRYKALAELDRCPDCTRGE